MILWRKKINSKGRRKIERKKSTFVHISVNVFKYLSLFCGIGCDWGLQGKG